jgi:hypothetical protein
MPDAPVQPIPDDIRMAGVLRYTTPRRRPRSLTRLVLTTAAIALVAVLGACSEDLDSGAACATLCPGTELQTRELTLNAITQEDVVPGILETGAELLLPLIDRKVTVQSRVAIRFDTLFTQFLDTLPAKDTIREIDSLSDATILLNVDRLGSTVQDSIVLDVYDVDNGTSDTTTAGIESRLVPGRRIGTRRIAKDYFSTAVGDTVAIPLDNSMLLAIIRRSDEARRRLRVAIKVSSPRSVVLRVAPRVSNTGGPVLRYRQVNTTALLGMNARSDEPGDATAAEELADFATIPVRPARRTDAVFAVGGLPARRTVLRFAIPDSIDAAAAIIQAELRMVQVPDPLRVLRDTVRVDTTTTGLRERADTVVVLPLIGVGGISVVGDPIRAGQLARRTIGSALNPFGVPALRVVPSDSGLKSIDISGLLRRWATQPDADPRYLVLTAGIEGAQSATAYFRSSAATDPAQRPTLYIRYIPRVGYGIP